MEKCENLTNLKSNLIISLRKKIEQYLSTFQYSSAVYWAEKLVTLSNGEVKDIYLYAQTLYHTEQYHRAINFLGQKNLIKKYSACRYLAALCYVACAEYVKALEILENPGAPSLQSLLKTPGKTTLPFLGNSIGDIDMDMETDAHIFGSSKIESSIQLLKGQIHDAMENRLLAAECYRDALQQDVMCYQAFDKLVQFQMMSSDEEKSLLSSLDFTGQLSSEEATLVELVYKNKVHKFSKPDDIVVPDWLDCLHDNNDIIVGLAERQFNICEYQECYAITSKIIKVDPFNSSCLPIHVAVLKELKRSNELFYLAHQLMKLYPKKTISWFSVGCYYLCIGKNDLARRHFMKSTQIDRQFGPGWLALGHAFAADKEHDQAIASYCTAEQVMKGCYIPTLYIGMEYGLSNNLNLADRFLNRAYEACDNDPFVLHEIATLAYERGRYTEALDFFQMAYDHANELTSQVPSGYWEPLLNNMAHTYRKLEDYDRALTLHRAALSMVPDNASSLSAIGLVLALSGRTLEAIDYLHRALAVRREDGFASALLTSCVKISMEDTALPSSIPDTLPAGLPSLTDTSTGVPVSLGSQHINNLLVTSDILSSPPTVLSHRGVHFHSTPAPTDLHSPSDVDEAKGMASNPLSNVAQQPNHQPSTSLSIEDVSMDLS